MSRAESKSREIVVYGSPGPDESALHEFSDPEAWHFNHCGRCGSGRTITPIDRQLGMMLCLDCGLYFDLRNLIKLN